MALTEAVERFDAVVVGSGFGGSVTTARLSEAGKRVCLLERGRAYPPGSFPRSPYDFSRAFWDPSEGHYGMYNVWSFKDLDVVISSGLGGGSLIYANVMLRKDPNWFVREDGVETWPVTREALDPHYDRVEQALGVQQFPIDHALYRDVPRPKAFRETARSLGWDPTTPNLAVTFSNPGADPVPGEPIHEPWVNLHGRTRTTCRLCGECDIGCNFGSKNTLDYNYLSAAKRAGADLRTLCEVRSFAPSPDGGWRVRYVRHDPAREGHPHETSLLPLESVDADRLILAAGTLGSTWLMMRNLPDASPLLGHRFCGNGDLLTLAMRPRRKVNGGTEPRLIDPGYGPAITSAVRFPDAADGAEGRGFYLEDVGYPQFLNWVIEASQAPSVLWRARHLIWRVLQRWLGREQESDWGAEIAALLGEADLSSGLLPLAGMGRDVPDGVLAVREDRLQSDWTIDRSSAYFERVQRTMRTFTDALGADFQDNPMWHFGRRVVTVHPLGGCPMGRDPSEGVVDAYGQVFGHPGLYIADGSVMPGPVGPNPSLTIAALADRTADHLLAS